MNKLTIIILLIAIASCNSNAPNPVYSSEKGVSFLKERKILSLEILKTLPIDYKVDEISVLSYTKLGVLNRFDQIIHSFDTNLEKQESFGAEGIGPSEFQRILDFKQFDNYFITLDRDARAIKNFTTIDSTLITFNRLPLNIERGLIMGFEKEPTVIVQSTNVGFTLNFDVIQNFVSEDDSIQINPLIEMNEQFKDRGSAIRDDGFLASNNCNTFFYASYLTNGIFKFDLSNKKITKGQFVYQNPEPEIYIDKHSAYPVVSKIHLTDIFATCSKVYILSLVLDKNDQFVIDLYDSNNLEYLYSYALPVVDDNPFNRPIQIAVVDDFLFAAYENELIKFKLNEFSSEKVFHSGGNL